MLGAHIKDIDRKVLSGGEADMAEEPPRERLFDVLMRRLEALAPETLISHNHYSEAEFWKTWNKENYDRAKAVTDPRGLFRDLYVKTCRAAMGRTEAETSGAGMEGATVPA